MDRRAPAPPLRHQARGALKSPDWRGNSSQGNGIHLAAGSATKTTPTVSAAWDDDYRREVNRQISRAGVINISVEIARAKADGRPPRLYLGRSA